MPISSILAPGTEIDMLKIDVEGFEIIALESALPYFESGKIRSSLVEFGPTCRWEKMHFKRNATEHARAVLSQLHRYKYDIHVFKNICRWSNDDVLKLHVNGAPTGEGLFPVQTSSQIECLLAPRPCSSGEIYMFILRRGDSLLSVRKTFKGI